VNETGVIQIQGKTQSLPAALYSSYLRSGLNRWKYLPPPLGFDRTFTTEEAANGILTGGCSNSAQAGKFQSCLWNINSVVLLSDRTSPGSINFELENSVNGISQSGMLVVLARTMANVSVAFLLSPGSGIIGDCTCDGHVDIDDILLVINSWGVCAGCNGDVDQNQVVNVDDLLAVITHWSP
jgi:hypothetical protein